MLIIFVKMKIKILFIEIIRYFFILDIDSDL